MKKHILNLPATKHLPGTTLHVNDVGDIQIMSGSHAMAYIGKEHLETVIKHLQGVVNQGEKPSGKPTDILDGSPLFKVKVIRDDYTGDIGDLSSLRDLNINIGDVFQTKLTNVGTYHVQSDQSTYGFALYLHPTEIAILEIIHE